MQHDLPGGGGLLVNKFVRWDRNSPSKTIPVIAIGFNWTRQDVMDCFYAGINEVIALPTSLHTIQRSILSGIYSERPFISTPSYCGPDRRRGMARGFHGPFRRLADTIATEVASAANKSSGDGRLIKAGAPIGKPKQPESLPPVDPGGARTRVPVKAAAKVIPDGSPLNLPHFDRPVVAGGSPGPVVPHIKPNPVLPPLCPPADPEPVAPDVLGRPDPVSSGLGDSGPGDSGPEAPHASPFPVRNQVKPPLPSPTIAKPLPPNPLPPPSSVEKRGAGDLTHGNALPLGQDAPELRRERDAENLQARKGEGHPVVKSSLPGQAPSSVAPPAPHSPRPSPQPISTDAGEGNALSVDPSSHGVAGESKPDAVEAAVNDGPPQTSSSA